MATPSEHGPSRSWYPPTGAHVALASPRGSRPVSQRFFTWPIGALWRRWLAPASILCMLAHGPLTGASHALPPQEFTAPQASTLASGFRTANGTVVSVSIEALRGASKSLAKQLKGVATIASTQESPGCSAMAEVLNMECAAACFNPFTDAGMRKCYGSHTLGASSAIQFWSRVIVNVGKEVSNLRHTLSREDSDAGSRAIAIDPEEFRKKPTPLFVPVIQWRAGVALETLAERMPRRVEHIE
jgi:hypothetical protein